MKEYEMLLAELIIKVAAMQKLLINSGIVSETQLVDEMKKISEEVVKQVQSEVSNARK